MPSVHKIRIHPAKIIVLCFVLGLCQYRAIASENQDKNSDKIYFGIKKKVIHKINPRIFGQFMERPSWGEIGIEGGLIPGTHRIQPAVFELLEKMEIPVIRFPGGTDVDFMDWRDMVDNTPNRAPQRPVSTGHRGHKVTNNFGYDEFLQFCEKVAAEAIIVVNFRDALLKKKPLKEAAMNAGALVAYIDALATADDKSVYFHAISRNFEQPTNVAIDLSDFRKLKGRAVHHILQGRLNDIPESDEEKQVGRISQSDIIFDGNRMKITLPKRSISCIEFSLN
jgi:alpha-L-arabinofuranosidase